VTRRESKATDPDLVGAETALRRAALRARETARNTGTPLVIWRDGKLVKEYVDSVGEEPPGYGKRSQ
jgi:hypothetical protein